MTRAHALRTELAPTLKLALPLVLAELGWMTMSIVDTIMVGHLPNSATAIGAVSVGSNIFTSIALCCVNVCKAFNISVFIGFVHFAVNV